jgi:3-oxoacyl-[acyl-carrier-protein] synthase-3
MPQPRLRADKEHPMTTSCWLAATAVRLPETLEPGEKLNAALMRPANWLQSRAGILQRRVWREEDPLAAAATAGQECLRRAALTPDQVGALLVTSEAPPLLAGMAAALHQRLGLLQETAAWEIGGACTGFLAALRLGQFLTPGLGAVLIVAVEAHSRYLAIEPGPAGEAAALFGDGAAAAVLTREPRGSDARAVGEVRLGADGGAGKLIEVEYHPPDRPRLLLQGQALAGRAVRTMARAVTELTSSSGLTVEGLAAVVAHGGNGRMPALLARQLGLPAELVWSETPWTGNLGSASVPAAWDARRSWPDGPVIWVSVGAGVTWGAALLGSRGESA